MTPGIMYSAQVYVPLFPSNKSVLNPYVQSRVGGGFPRRQSSIMKFSLWPSCSGSYHFIAASPLPSNACRLSFSTPPKPRFPSQLLHSSPFLAPQYQGPVLPIVPVYSISVSRHVSLRSPPLERCSPICVVRASSFSQIRGRQ